MSRPTRILILTAILALAPASLAADSPVGLHDVTAKLTAAVKDDALNFAVSADALLGQPSSGDPQKLKIEFTQGDHSHIRVFAETQTALIPALSGQKLVIRTATFGPLPDPVDVTPKLLAAAKPDSITFTVDDDSLGIDPNPGTDKILILRYAIDGTQHLLLTNQNDTLHLDKPAGAKTFTILQASYGVAQQNLDVTEIVDSNIKGNHLTIGASNDTFADPSEGDTKQLLVAYTVDGTPHTARTEEYKPQLHLPLPSDGPGTLRITTARYGTALDPPK